MRLETTIALLLPLAACAFKGGDDGAGPVPSPSVVPIALLARVSWWTSPDEKSAVLTRSLDGAGPAGTLHAHDAVTLPTTIPDTLDVELDLAGGLTAVQAGMVVAQGVRNSTVQPLTVKKAVLAKSDADTSVLVVEVSGLQSLMTDGQQAELRIIVNSSDGTFATVCIPLRTPPSLVQVSAMPLKQADSSGVQIDAGIKVLDADGGPWGVLAVVQLRNVGDRDVESSWPIALGGEVVKRGVSYRAASVPPCGSTSGAESYAEVFADSLAALPLDGTTLRTLLAWRKGAAKTASVVVPVGEIREVGLYGAGRGPALVSNGKFAPSAPQKVSTLDHCDSKCDHMRMGDGEFPACWTAYAYRSGAAATPLAEVNQCLACGRGDQTGCNECRRWEETARMFDGFGPSGGKSGGPNCLFCGELQQQGGTTIGTLEWRDEAVYSDRPVGEEDRSLTVEFQRGPLAQLRHADVGWESDPMSRPIALLPTKLELLESQDDAVRALVARLGGR
jgi:hypothetical protein